MVPFADDTAFLSPKSCKKIKDVEFDLESMNAWFAVNKMTVNVSE